MRRTPWLTSAVAGLTAAVLGVQELVPGTLASLERTPEGVWPEPWRLLTSLLVQDGWLLGGVFNIAGVVLVGAALEQVATRRAWLGAYLGGGLAGQLFGHVWQPVGGGNSVAVCGIAGLLAVLVARGLDGGVALARIAPPIWCGWVAAPLFAPLVLLGAVVGVLTNGPMRSRPWSRWVVPGFCALCAVSLLVTRDLHGGALATALLVAALPGVAERAAEQPGAARPAAPRGVDR